MDRQSSNDKEEEMDEDSENSQLLRLMARHTQLRDLLDAHHLIGTKKTRCSILFLCYSPTY